VAAEEAGLPERIAAALLPLIPLRDEAATARCGRDAAVPEPSGTPVTRKVDEQD
jgi:hypothetical protein